MIRDLATDWLAERLVHTAGFRSHVVAAMDVGDHQTDAVDDFVPRGTTWEDLSHPPGPFLAPRQGEGRGLLVRAPTPVTMLALVAVIIGIPALICGWGGVVAAIGFIPLSSGMDRSTPKLPGPRPLPVVSQEDEVGTGDRLTSTVTAPAAPLERV
jgi:hypothetical protein